MKNENQNQFVGFLLMCAIAVAITIGGAGAVFSDENIGEKAESKVDEMKKDSKINARKARRKARNANCTSADRKAGKCGPVEDAKDGIKNVGDEVDHNAKKLKNKVD